MTHITRCGTELSVIKDRAVSLPMIDGEALHVCLRFCAACVSGVESSTLSDRYGLQSNPNMLLDVAMAASFLQCAPLITYVARLLATVCENLTDPDIEIIPDDVFYEMVLHMPFRALFTKLIPHMTDERCCVVCQARWVLPKAVFSGASLFHSARMRETPSTFSSPVALNPFRPLSETITAKSPAPAHQQPALHGNPTLISPFATPATIHKMARLDRRETRSSVVPTKHPLIDAAPPPPPPRNLHIIYHYYPRPEDPAYWQKLLLQLAVQDQISTLTGVDEVDSVITAIEEADARLTVLTVRNDVPEIVSTAAAICVWRLCNLKTIDVSRANLGPEGVLPLVEALKTNRTVERLNVGNNRLKERGAAYIGELLASHTALATLHMEHNNIGPNGAERVADALGDNTTLVKLAIGYNQIQHDGVRRVALALERNSTVQMLDIANNYITDDGAACVARLLGVNRALQVVRMWDTTISTVGGTLVQQTVMRSTTVTEVGLGLDSLDPAERVAMLRHCEANRARLEATGTEMATSPPADGYAARRVYERDLLYGTDTIYSDTWYLISEQWLAAWRRFVARGSTTIPPGPITNDIIVDATGTPRPGLRKLFDYRGVHPRVWDHFLRIYGGGPAVRRSKIDLYCVPVDAGAGLEEEMTDVEWPRPPSSTGCSDTDSHPGS